MLPSRESVGVYLSMEFLPVSNSERKKNRWSMFWLFVTVCNRSVNLQTALVGFQG
jgi:hypothetical protein